MNWDNNAEFKTLCFSSCYRSRHFLLYGVGYFISGELVPKSDSVFIKFSYSRFEYTLFAVKNQALIIRNMHIL